MDMRPFALMLMGVGALLVVAGLFLYLGSGFTIPFLGKLPGDIRIERDNFRFYFPVATCILISVILSAVLALVSLLRR